MAYDHLIQTGTTSQMIEVFLRDSTTGQGKGSLAYGDMTILYQREGAAAAVSVTLASGSAGTWSSGGWVAVPSGAAGLYQFGIPNAALVAGAGAVTLTFAAAGTITAAKRVVLTGINVQDAVRCGMTSLPNANAEAAGGMYTRGTGAGQINQPANGQIDANAAKAGGQTITAAAGITMGAYVGNTTAALSVDASGRVDIGKIAGQTASAAAGVTFPATIGTSTFAAGGNVNVDTIKTQAVTCAAPVTVLASVGTAGASTAQTGDCYAIVNHIEHGNAAIRTLVAAIQTILSGITNLGNWIRAFGRKSAPDATALSEINSGGGTYSGTTDSLEAIRDRGDAAWTTGGGGGGGDGANAITLTVTDGVDPISAVKVRFSGGPTSSLGVTDGDGAHATALDNGTYTLTLSHPYYQPLVVSGIAIDAAAELGPYALSPLVVTPAADPAQCMGYVICRDAHGDALAAITLSYRLVSGPGAAGVSYPRRAVATAASGADGLVEVALVKGAAYQFSRDGGKWIDVTVGQADTQALPEILGQASA